MSLDKNHINYSTDYLLKYLSGELSDKEMQALEKAALEDPFLSDAIDGLQEAAKHSPSFESSVAELQERLSERVAKQKKKRGIVFMLPRWQVAASILVLASLTTLTITLIKQNSIQKSISSVSKKDTQQVTVQPAPIIVQNNADTIKIEKKAEPPVTTLKKPPEPTPKKRSELNPALQLQGQAEGVVISRHPAPASTDYKVSGKKDSLHYVQGLVLDDSGKAIAEASVHLSGEHEGTATDSNGYFKLYLNKEKKNQEIAINSIGFKPVKAAVPADSSLSKFQMQNAPGQLNEVVVTALGIQRKKDVTGSVTVVKSENYHPDVLRASQPQGWQALNNYINENKKINNADSVLKGEEIISFVVNKKGNLSSIKIIKSISPSHDEEIIRLLISGPKLQPADGKKHKYQIIIAFN